MAETIAAEKPRLETQQAELNETIIEQTLKERPIARNSAELSLGHAEPEEYGAEDIPDSEEKDLDVEMETKKFETFVAAGLSDWYSLKPI